VRLGWEGQQRSSHHRTRACFNEAEARAPRMGLRPSPGGHLSAPRFNEAEARAPRMGRVGRRARAAEVEASMRPRRVRLGWAEPFTAGGTFLNLLQ